MNSSAPTANAPITMAYMARGNFFIISSLLVLREVPTGTDRELPPTFYGARAAREAADRLHRNVTVGSSA
jgi:hypothetical protein